MTGLRQGSFRLFRFAGVDVFIHWSWFLIALIEINARRGQYSSAAWNVFEYLALFAIVLTHEFGHALACRQVGGNASQIVLWPLGGVAYVDPPPRPGATLWSIAAGPLVNVALVPVFLAIGNLSRTLGWYAAVPDLHQFLRSVAMVNVWLLLFNMLPIFPLDGGQILRSLLWFVMGRARSLMVAVVLGFIGMAGFFAIAILRQSPWFGVLGGFMLLNCWGGLQHARALLRLAKLPRRIGFACPWCKSAPPVGDHWICSQCGHAFDTFQSQAVCPNCSVRYAGTRCLDCGHSNRLDAWAAPALAPPIV
jgi:Zn-dependent protease